MDKQIIFSGIQPSGSLTLGNYIGALRNWVKLENEYECYYCVVDMHALTVRQNASELRRRCVETMALLIACGLNPDKSTIFMQSHVSAHAELAWILNCNTYIGELSRMTQFKEKSERHSENINSGLFTYPVLMAADILLYQSNLVPVGADQKQHLELSRDIAIRFNNAFGETFTVPDGYIPEVGARVMSLQEPEKKMSKSDDNENAYIALLDPPDTILRKIKRAVTDSDGQIAYRDDKPGVSNLLSIYSACTGKTIKQAEAEFDGQGYGSLKSATAEAVIATLSTVQQNYSKLMADKTYLTQLINKGAETAAGKARPTLSKVYRKVGLAPRKL
jgi:tryptophanyl-tRNA synthetase